MLELFLKKTYNIDFNEENKERFTTLLTEIYVFLRDSAYTTQANCLMQILYTVQEEDKDLL